MNKILILGGGPAGAATALMLQQQHPNLHIQLIEKTNLQHQRIGEALSPDIVPLLHQLGVWEAFLAEGHLPAYGTSAAWGSMEVYANEFIYQRNGKGWHLDRNRFDRFLLREAETRGVKIHLNAQAKLLTKTDSDFTFEIEAKDKELQELTVDFVIDATGRKAQFARSQGAQKIRFDNLVGIGRFYEFEDPTAIRNSYTLVEASENGWWYSAILPDGKLAIAYMTDSDYSKATELHISANWEALLQQSRHTQIRAKEANAISDLQLWPAASQRLDCSVGARWIAVGDAASTFDPLSSQGIFKALKTGIFAAYAIKDWQDGELNALSKYDFLMRDEYSSYLGSKAKFYRGEQRWMDASFWKRRHAIVTLDPSAILCLEKPDFQVRYFLSEAEQRLLKTICEMPKQAAELIAKLQTLNVGYSDDLRLILGVEYLIEVDILRVINT